MAARLLSSGGGGTKFILGWICGCHECFAANHPISQRDESKERRESWDGISQAIHIKSTCCDSQEGGDTQCRRVREKSQTHGKLGDPLGADRSPKRDVRQKYNNPNEKHSRHGHAVEHQEGAGGGINREQDCGDHACCGNGECAPRNAVAAEAPEPLRSVAASREGEEHPCREI